MKLNRSITLLIAKGILALFVAICSSAWSMETIRLGVLKFGTVNWELEVIRRQGLDKKNGFKLEVIPLAGKNATHISLLGAAVDVIVTDWIWVSRQRNAGQDFTFSPYSAAAGSLMVRPDSNINSLGDLQGKQLGVAGGAVDKSWLLLSAYVQKVLGQPIEKILQPSFAAPPLINALITRNEIPAALNFWHYSARLHADGMHELLRIEDILPELGIPQRIPLIGWVFKQSWAEQNSALVNGFLSASREAKQLMQYSDDIWSQIEPLLKVNSPGQAVALRDAFRAGIISCFNAHSQAAIEKTYEVLAHIGGSKLVGETNQLSEGTIWPGAINKHCS